jgi:hypothetical protein
MTFVGRSPLRDRLQRSSPWRVCRNCSLRVTPVGRSLSAAESAGVEGLVVSRSDRLGTISESVGGGESGDSMDWLGVGKPRRAAG